MELAPLLSPAYFWLATLADLLASRAVVPSIVLYRTYYRWPINLHCRLED